MATNGLTSDFEAEQSEDGAAPRHAVDHAICIHQWLQRPVPDQVPVFLRDDDFKAKVVVLQSVAEGVVVIRSASDGDELIVGANGGCYFESCVLGIGEEFKVEAIANGSVVFVSCRTGHVLDTDDTGFPVA